MRKRIYCSDQLSPLYFGIGSSRFARFDNERATTGGNVQDLKQSVVPVVADRVLGVVADMYVQKQIRNNMALPNVSLPWTNDQGNDDPLQAKQPQQRCGGGCPPEDKKSELDSLLALAEKTGDVKLVALEKVENEISQDQEYGGITIHFARYKKESNNGWKNKGRDLVELVEEERRDRYQTLKDEMDGAKQGIILSEEAKIKDFNYIQVFTDTGGTIEMVAVEHRGDINDFKKVYEALKKESRDVGSGQEIEFGRPLFYSQPLTLEHIAEVIERNFDSEESKAQSEDYLSRLHRDVEDPSLIESYQKEVEVLAQKTEQELIERSHENGLAMAIIGMMTLVEEKQKESSISQEVTETIRQVVNDTRETIVGVIEYVSTRTDQRLQETESMKDLVQTEASFLLKKLLTETDGTHKLAILTAEPSTMRTDDKTRIRRWKRIAQKELRITPKQSEHLLIEMQQTWTMTQNALEVIGFVDQTGVGIGAAYTIFEPFVTSNVDTLSIFSNEAQPVGLPEIFSERDGIINFHSEEIENVIDQIVAKHHDVKSAPSTSKESNLSKQKEESPINDVVVGWVKEFVRVFDKKTPHEAVTLIETEEKRIIQKIDLLREVFEEFITNGEKSLSEEEPLNTEAEKPIRELSFAVMVWMMMQLDSYLQVLHSMKDALAEIVLLMKDPETKTTLKQKASSLFKKHLSEGLVKQEGSSWLLFAIIWYLAMIREQGVVGVVNNQKPVKKKKAVLLRQLYPSGIIFAYAPTPDPQGGSVWDFANRNRVVEAQFVIE